MSAAPWTPGPWKAEGDEVWAVGGRRINVNEAGEVRICMVDDHYAEGWTAEGSARLIAAAPEMAEALMGTTVSLIAAISLLERGGKKAAPSDRMFAHMLSDYQKRVDEARALLSRIRGDAP